MCLVIMKRLILETVKGKENIKEYIMKMSNLAPKLKSLKLESGEDLIVHLILISLPTHFGYITMCKRKRGCREIRLKVFILLRPFKIRKGRTLRMLQKGLLNERKLGAGKAKDVLELIHIDICGPFPTTSLNGQQYSFKAEVELQLGKKIKAVKSDRGGEYYGRYDGSGEQRPRPFALFLRECEIVPQYTMPGKPSMKGVVEQ
ncbi:hypothetical protein CR513_39575, partial [Mucuna pruriens]